MLQEFLIKEGQQSTLQQAIEKLTAELAELQEKEEELQESMRLKSDSVSGDGGNTQVVRIKDAIHTLKLQIRAMSMDISLRNHSLQQERIKQQQRNSKYRKKKSLEDSMSLLDDL